MGRADQPILMHGVELNPLPVFENFGSAHERDVVIVDDVKTFIQDSLDLRRLEKGKTGQVGSQGREKTGPALEAVDGYVGMILIAVLGLL
jgi:hypothetical protein